MEKNIDKLDLQVLSFLLKDAKTPYTEIAKQLNVSGGTIHVRIKKLEALNVITGTTLCVDYGKLGFSLTAFLGIHLVDGKNHDEILKKLKDIPEVIEIHYTTGKFYLFAKIICKDSYHLKKVLINGINRINGIEKTETMISLGETKIPPVELLKN